jgi:hypothetical protein
MHKITAHTCTRPLKSPCIVCKRPIEVGERYLRATIFGEDYTDHNLFGAVVCEWEDLPGSDGYWRVQDNSFHPYRRIKPAELTQDEWEIMLHAYGAYEVETYRHQIGWRDYVVVDREGADADLMKGLEKRGLAKCHGANAATGGDDLYRLTMDGRRMVSGAKIERIKRRKKNKKSKNWEREARKVAA